MWSMKDVDWGPSGQTMIQAVAVLLSSPWYVSVVENKREGQANTELNVQMDIINITSPRELICPETTIKYLKMNTINKYRIKPTLHGGVSLWPPLQLWIPVVPKGRFGLFQSSYEHGYQLWTTPKKCYELFILEYSLTETLWDVIGHWHGWVVSGGWCWKWS